MRWKLHFLWSLATLGFIEAQASTLDVVETVHYNYTFELQDGVINIVPFADWFDECCFDVHYRAEESPTLGVYSPYLTLEFWHYGNDTLDLKGQTIDIQSISSSTFGIEEVYYDFMARPDYSGPSGYMTFGEDNTVSDWYVWGYLPVAGEGESHSATAEPIPDWWDSVNFDSFAGRDVYGFGQYNQYGGTFWTNPGRWTTSIERICYIAEGGSQAPCPDPAPPLNGCGPSDGVAANCDTIALVPLPPSLLLLLSGLAGVGMLRGRRTRLAG